MTKNASDIGHGLPFDLPLLESCGSYQVKSGTTIIAAAGFEPRALAFCRTIDKVGDDVSAIVIRYEPGDVRNRLVSLVAMFRKKKISVDVDRDIVDFNRFTPDDFGNALSVRLAQRGQSRVVLDISAMSKMALLLSLEVCRELNLDVSLFYAEAKTYGPGRRAYVGARARKQIPRPSIQVYSGIGEVVRSARLSSVAMQGEPVAAVMFMSFNEFLTQSLLNCVYPSRLILINGLPPEHVWREEATAWIHERLRAEWPEDDNPVDQQGLPCRKTSTLHYQETVSALLKVYWDLSTNYRLIFAPTGSKMQTLGLFLARALHPDVHVEYPTPKGYLKLYTSGIGRKWKVQYGALGLAIEKWRAQDKARALGIDSIIGEPLMSELCVD